MSSDTGSGDQAVRTVQKTGDMGSKLLVHVAPGLSRYCNCPVETYEDVTYVQWVSFERHAE